MMASLTNGRYPCPDSPQRTSEPSASPNTGMSPSSPSTVSARVSSSLTVRTSPSNGPLTVSSPVGFRESTI